MEETLDMTLAEVPAGYHCMAVMGKVGDTKIIWDSGSAVEVENARAQFDRFRRDGYAAFHVRGKSGEKGEQMHEFDPKAERIMFAPQMQGG